MQGVPLDTEETDTVTDEDITTYHHIDQERDKKIRVISQILDDHGDLQNDKEAIVNIFTSFLGSKYKAIPCNSNSFLYLTSGDMPNTPKEANMVLENPITKDELHTAVENGKRHKSPGPDSISHEFYKYMWENCNEDLLDVLNNIYIEGEASTGQKHGHIVRLPKVNNPVSPEHYRPLTILNTDYKLLIRILAYRLRPWMEEVIHHNQYCGRNGKQYMTPLPQNETSLHMRRSQIRRCAYYRSISVTLSTKSHMHFYLRSSRSTG